MAWLPAKLSRVRCKMGRLEEMNPLPNAGLFTKRIIREGYKVVVIPCCRNIPRSCSITSGFFCMGTKIDLLCRSKGHSANRRW